MANISVRAPLWAQRNAAARAESRGQDPTPYIQTAPGGVPGRIRGVSALQRIASMKAYRGPTSLRAPQQPVEQPPQAAHGELRRGADGSIWRFNAATGAGEQVTSGQQQEPETMLLTNKDAAMQQFANRRKQLIGGGISAPDASLAAGQEYIASPNFTGPQNYKPKPIIAEPVNKRPGADQGAIAKIRAAAMQRRPKVQY